MVKNVPRVFTCQKIWATTTLTLACRFSCATMLCDDVVQRGKLVAYLVAQCRRTTSCQVGKHRWFLLLLFLALLLLLLFVFVLLLLFSVFAIDVRCLFVAKWKLVKNTEYHILFCIWQPVKITNCHILCHVCQPVKITNYYFLFRSPIRVLACQAKILFSLPGTLATWV